MQIFKNRTTIILVFALVFLFVISYGGYQKYIANKQSATQSLEEVELIFDPEGPYAMLFPRRDGNALVLNIRRIASFDEFAYQVTYSDEEGIDRGAGFLETWIKLPEGKGEYEQEVLFGTCSRNVCKYDKGVENGTLTLRLKKGNKIYKTSSLWHLQKPDIALGVLTSGDSHFALKIDPKSVDLPLIKFSLITELSGAPKLPEGKQVLGKVYSLNSPESKTLPGGVVTLEMAEDSPNDAKLTRFNELENKWVEYETKIEGSKLSATVDGGGIFTVLIPKK